jgi:serine/threonine protein kinase/Tfp pilus assembly protein PilF
VSEEGMPRHPPDEEPTRSYPRDSAQPQSKVGNYRLLQRVGEGGMGEVWEAEQLEPVKRRVALKLIKWGMQTREVIARFESERQALALMDHPNIARVFDGGATAEGRPYFVMELVRGVPLTQYCDDHRLDTRERLDLYLQICDGIQHAHHKGIIHRDLKPSNVLVSDSDEGQPSAKIIDFGVAKAISQRLTEQTLFTQLGQWVGTPEYMSPEQAAMSTEVVDTRSDVYALGVILYELLVGAPPLDGEKLRRAGFDELRRHIREAAVEKPSRRLSSLGAKSTRVAERRRTEPVALVRSLRGDLDWIALKALEKDRTRRYSSASELAADIGRYLRDEAVLARPPSTSYRLSKFVRRHKTGVVAATVVLVSLVAGTGVSLWQAVRATAAERVARQEAATARQVSDFLVQLFHVSDPDEALGNEIRAREILDQGARRIESELADQPLVQARLMSTMGTVYRKLALYDRAEPLFRQSLAMREELLPASDLAVAESLHSLGELLLAQNHTEEAESLIRRALATVEATRGPDHPDLAPILVDLAGVELARDRFDAAEAGVRRALAIQEESLEPGDPQIATTLLSLAGIRSLQGHVEDAPALLERALEINEQALGPDHPDTQTVMTVLGSRLAESGDFERAEALLRRAVASGERVLGPDHPRLAGRLTNLAIFLARRGELEEAEALFERSLSLYTEAYGPRHPSVAAAEGNLAWGQHLLGKLEEAEQRFERALVMTEEVWSGQQSSLAILLRDFADLRMEQQRYREAEVLQRRCLEIREAVLGAGHLLVAECAHELANSLRAQGKLADAEMHYRRALAIREDRLGAAVSQVADVLEDYALLLRDADRADEATPLEVRAAAIRTKKAALTTSR